MYMPGALIILQKKKNNSHEMNFFYINCTIWFPMQTKFLFVATIDLNVCFFLFFLLSFESHFFSRKHDLIPQYSWEANYISAFRIKLFFIQL